MQHVEKHFSGSETVRDVVIGMADGLTVPFALAAGISGAIASSRIVVTAGIAEVAAGAIAMALGGYLAARTDAERRDDRRLVRRRRTRPAAPLHARRRFGSRAARLGDRHDDRARRLRRRQ